MPFSPRLCYRYDDVMGPKHSSSVNSQILSMSMGTLIKHRRHGIRMQEKIPHIQAIPAFRAKLPIPIHIHLTHKAPLKPNVEPQCVFWDPVQHDWNTDTCNLMKFNSTHSTCSCQRFSSYSVLTKYSEDVEAISNNGLDSAALIAIIVLSVCLAIVFFTSVAILVVYYQRIKVFQTDLIQPSNFY